MAGRCVLFFLQLSGCLGVFGPSGFIEYREGNTGIIIAVPHGGEWDSPDIPPQTQGTSEGDDDTKELGEAVTSSICTNLGKCPHMIISYLKRSKLDPNREIVEAAQGDPLAEAAWEEYHGFIEEAKKKEGLGLVIDLHGQSHMKNSTELGYLLTTEQLNAEEFNSEVSSVRELSRRQGISGEEVIVGSLSLGSFLEDEGYKAFPSPRQHSPGDWKYFIGFYTVVRHGSRDQGAFDAISVETPREVRMDAGRDARIEFGQALGKAIGKFYIANYPQDTESSAVMSRLPSGPSFVILLVFCLSSFNSLIKL